MAKDDKVQLAIRLTEQEREAIKELANKQNKSMTQYILDSTLASDNSDNASAKKDNDSKLDDASKNDSKELAFYIEQITEKDKQIAILQRLLDQQQQLALADKQEKEQLKLALKEEVEQPGKQKTFLQRLFNL